MNYEKLYKEALERAKTFKSPYCQHAAEVIFPELKESEDEQHRKWILEYLYDGLRKADEQFKDQYKSAIAWFEKQGKKKTEIEYIYPKFRIGDVIEPIKPNGFYRPIRVLSVEKKTKSYYCESDDKKSFSSIPIRCENEYKLYEQKPAWSEEDEANMDAIWKACGIVYGTKYQSILGDWLKSLKHRWKPSEYDKSNGGLNYGQSTTNQARD